jgi:hypothetical protein
MFDSPYLLLLSSVTPNRVMFSYIPFTFPHTSKCFLSNGTKNVPILASGPKLQAVRFWYVILGENFKKEADP